MADTPDTKRCTKCGETKPADAFGIRRAGGRRKRDTLRSHCKACESKAVLERDPIDVRRERTRQSILRVHGSKAAMKEKQRRAAGKPTRADWVEAQTIAAQQRRTERVERIAAAQAQREAAWAEARRLREEARLARLAGAKHPEHVRAAWRERDRKRRSQYHHRMNKRLLELVRSALLGKPRRPALLPLLPFTVEQLRAHMEHSFTGGMTWDAFEHGRIHIDHVVPRAALVYTSTNDEAFRQLWALSNLQPLWARDNIAKGARPLAAAA